MKTLLDGSAIVSSVAKPSFLDAESNFCKVEYIEEEKGISVCVVGENIQTAGECEVAAQVVIGAVWSADNSIKMDPSYPKGCLRVGELVFFNNVVAGIERGEASLICRVASMRRIYNCPSIDIFDGNSNFNNDEPDKASILVRLGGSLDTLTIVRKNVVVRFTVPSNVDNLLVRVRGSVVQVCSGERTPQSSKSLCIKHSGTTVHCIPSITDTKIYFDIPMTIFSEAYIDYVFEMKQKDFCPEVALNASIYQPPM